MIFTEHERDIALRLFGRVAEETADPAGGITRESYGPGETKAWSLVAEAARSLGIIVSSDHADNLLMSVGPVGSTDVIMIGSHLDSVPCGGNFDGLAGVIAALLVLKKAKESRSSLNLVGVGFRGEESAWFGIPHVGAKAMLGQLLRLDLKLRHRVSLSRNLRAAITHSGGYALKIEDGVKSFEPRSIREYWELHIEQGPILATKKIPVGIVESIRGHVRTTNARIFGLAGHSGTTPMYMRKDAVVKFANLMTALEHCSRDMIGEGHDLVFTVGTVGTNPARHAVTAIADEVMFSLDVRSSSDVSLDNFIMSVKAYGGQDFDLGDVRRAKPCVLTNALVARATHAADVLRIDRQVMRSGAGHDASVFIEAGVDAGMIFVRNEGGSHNPHERMDMDDFMLGVETLWAAIRQ